MDIECPHCNIEQKLDDITPTLKKGRFKCPVCGGKFPSPFAEHQEIASSFRLIKYFILIFILAGIAAVLVINYFFKPV